MVCMKYKLCALSSTSKEDIPNTEQEATVYIQGRFNLDSWAIPIHKFFI